MSMTTETINKDFALSILLPKAMDLDIHRTCRGPTLVIPHSLVELAGSPILACIYIYIYIYIFIYFYTGTTTTEHTNIKNTNNK